MPAIRGRAGFAGAADFSDVPDVLGPDLRIVFCGINPGRVSAAAHAHFANPRNDFWRLLHAARLTSRLYEPAEQFELLKEGIGITNAAFRTTPGSGDLRRGDFDVERIERLVRDLRPEWLAFVGKEAYRGLFGERPELGLRARTLGATRLFVLPSTSPANAAVPWRERLRWFQELAGRASPLPIREIVRAVVVDDDRRTVLLRYASEYEEWWTTPGGGCEPGEDDDQALRRELREELGLEEFAIGPRLWELEYWNLDEPGFSGARARVYSVRVPAFEARLLTEGLEVRWFTLDEVAAVPTRPHDLAQRLRSTGGWC